jgi:hypothetical protein
MSRVKAIGGGVEYDRVRLQISDDIFRLFDAQSGDVLVEGAVTTFVQTGKIVTATVDGVEWTMTRRGCGCGNK